MGGQGGLLAGRGWALGISGGKLQERWPKGLQGTVNLREWKRVGVGWGKEREVGEGWEREKGLGGDVTLTHIHTGRASPDSCACPLFPSQNSQAHPSGNRLHPIPQ